MMWPKPWSIEKKARKSRRRGRDGKNFRDSRFQRNRDDSAEEIAAIGLRKTGENRLGRKIWK
jgi:hypothetical protein